MTRSPGVGSNARNLEDCDVAFPDGYVSIFHQPAGTDRDAAGLFENTLQPEEAGDFDPRTIEPRMSVKALELETRRRKDTKLWQGLSQIIRLSVQSRELRDRSSEDIQPQRRVKSRFTFYSQLQAPSRFGTSRL